MHDADKAGDPVATQPRYALYFAPDPGSPLWHFGSAVIGYDAVQGKAVPFPSNMPLSPEVWTATTAEPRRYGFHATLKAPFQLRPTVTEKDVIAHAAVVASLAIPFSLGVLKVDLIGNFVALVPVSTPQELYGLEAECVQRLDALRAPLSDADRARRLSTHLSARQKEHLDRWGYPHVLDAFRFHMTLTGRLNADEAPVIVQALHRLYAPISAPVIVASICVFRQDNRNARFRMIHRMALGSSS